MGLPSHWEGEDVILTFEEEGKDAVKNMECQINSFNITGGSSTTDEVFLFGGCTINFQKPREKFEISIEGISPNTDPARIAHGESSGDPGNPGSLAGVEIRAGGALTTQRRWRVVFWFIDPTTGGKATTGSGLTKVVVPKTQGGIYRIIVTDAKITGFEQEMAADDMLKFNMTLEFSAADDSAFSFIFNKEEDDRLKKRSG